MPHFTALFDACVLYPAPLRDFLISLASEDLFRGRWTDAIHDEWINNLLADRPELSAQRLQITRKCMDDAVEDCLITDYEDLIDSLDLSDANDRHVLAAAITGRVDVTVTFNLKDFPNDYLEKYGIEAQHPDTFIKHLLGLFPHEVCSVFKQMRENLKNPPKSVEEMLATLAKAATYANGYSPAEGSRFALTIRVSTS